MLTTSNLRNGVATLSSRANLDLAAVWRQVDGPDQAKAALNDVLPALVDKYGQASATLAAHWYDELRHQREIRGGFRAITADLSGGTSASTTVLTGVAVGPLYSRTPDVAAARVLVAGGLQRRIANYARSTVTQSSVADPGARGWQRVGDGSTCDFCSMLLGRGAVYTEASADFEAHDHCQCGAEPAWR